MNSCVYYERNRTKNPTKYNYKTWLKWGQLCNLLYDEYELLLTLQCSIFQVLTSLPTSNTLHW